MLSLLSRSLSLVVGEVKYDIRVLLVCADREADPTHCRILTEVLPLRVVPGHWQGEAWDCEGCDYQGSAKMLYVPVGDATIAGEVGCYRGSGVTHVLRLGVVLIVYA